MPPAPLRVGLIGCGNISGVYARNAGRSRSFRILSCADAVPARAEALSREHSIPRASPVEDLLTDPEVEAILNLTTPDAHGPVGLAALRAGRHLYTEKPLAATRAEGAAMLDLAASRGLLIAAAPDTFLGPGLQTCRRLIDEGQIGFPVAASLFMACRGHESWHPDPEFYYQPGGGPLFDMGPYYLTAIVSLLGPVARVRCESRASFPTRTIATGPKKGQTITVNTPTHIAGQLRLRSGAIVTLIMSFDVRAHSLPCIEIYGSEATLSAPDPNTFAGPVRLHTGEAWQDIPVTGPHADNARGIGLSDLARAVRTGEPHRTNGELAFHVLDIMHSLLESARRAAAVDVTSTCDRPIPLPPGWREGDWMH
jgi:predicted dehydrogenase